MKPEPCLQKAHSLGTNPVSFVKVCILEASLLLYLFCGVLLIFALYIYFCLFVLELH